MWNSAKNPQEEKYQQKIEAILEENHKHILDKSHFLINIIFIIIGAYALILVAIFFPSYQIPQNNSVDVNQLLNDNTLKTSIFFSIACIIIAFGFLWRSLYLGDENIMGKFKKKNVLTEVKLTQRNFITVCRDTSICLKHGNELKDRNCQLFKNVKNQLKSNDLSICSIVLSLLFFIVFVLLIKISWVFIIFIGIVFLVLLFFTSLLIN